METLLQAPAARPAGVTLLAAAHFGLAGFALLLGLLLTFAPPDPLAAFGGPFASPTAPEEPLRKQVAAVLLVALLSAFLAWVGAALLRGRGWARVAAVAVAAFVVLGGVRLAMLGDLPEGLGRVALGAWAGAYLLRPRVRAWFAASRPSRAEAP